MRALVAHAPRDIRLADVLAPTPDAEDLLLDVRAVGICGSDVHLFRGDHPYRVFPLIYGHEFTATVASGPGFVPGETVVVEPLLNCGACYPCRLGRYNCCTNLKVVGVHVNGGFADQIAVPARRVHRVPPDLPAAIAALCEPFSIGMQATLRGQIGPEDRVAILGAGPIGLTVLAIARSRSAEVAVIDMLDNRLELAGRMGANRLINARREDPQAAVLEFTGGDGASVVVEATGNPRAMESTVDLVASAGRVVIVGLPDQPVTFSGVVFTRKELTILGSRNSANCFADAVRFVVEHRDLVAQMITQRVPFADVVEAFHIADERPDQVCKIVVELT
jgi:L-gulonate 5-dehydrogenase